MTKAKAIKKVQIAINKMIDLSYDGYENDCYIQEKVSRILDALRELENMINS